MRRFLDTVDLAHPERLLAGSCTWDRIVWTDGGCVDYRNRGIRVLLASIDISRLRNPIYNAHAQHQVVIHSLPGSWPSQVAMAAAFSEHPPLALCGTGSQECRPRCRSARAGLRRLHLVQPSGLASAMSFHEITQETRHDIRIGRAETLVFVQASGRAKSPALPRGLGLHDLFVTSCVPSGT
jgi:hypothetical protein